MKLRDTILTLLIILALIWITAPGNEPAEPKPAQSETETTFSISGVPVYRSYRMEARHESE